jgi:hypothetical protein
MAFIYEVNGQRVEFEKEPTEKDIDEAARALAPAPESRMPKPVEGSGGAAFGVYRPQGRRPESQNQNRESNKEMATQTGRGVLSNIPVALSSPISFPSSAINMVANAPRTIQDIQNRYQSVRSQLAGNERQPLPELPEYNKVAPYDIGFFANLVPGAQPETPAQAMAFAGGQAVGSPLIPKTFSAVAPTVKYGANLAKDVAGVAGSPVQSARTAFDAFGRGYKNPANVGGEGSALMPIREKFYPHEQVAEFQAGQRTPLQMSEVSTTPLTQNNMMNRFASNMAPTNKAGEALVAPKGRGLEGYFENLGSTYKQNPYLGVLDAVTGLGGIAAGFGPTPITALSKSIPALAARQLQKATQFEPNFNANAIKAVQARSALDPLQNPIPMQQPLLLPAPSGPVRPTQTMYVNPEGVATTNLQGTQTNYKPARMNTPNFANARQQNQMAAQQSQQMAAQKLQEIQARQAQPSLEQQTIQAGSSGENILAQIRARNNPTSGGSLFDPANTPSSIEASIDALPSDRFSFADKLALKRAELQKNPPAPEPPMTAAEIKQQTKDFKVSSVEEGREIIKRLINGDSPTENVTGSMSTQGRLWGLDKDMNTDNREITRMVRKLQSEGIEELPFINGMSEEQIVRLAHQELTGKKSGKKATPYTPTETKSTSSLQEALNKVKTKNETKTTNARPENISKEDWAVITEPAPKRSAYDPTDPVGEKQKALESFEHIKKIKEMKEKNNLSLSSRTEMDIDKFVDSIKQQLKDPVKLIEDEIGKVKNQITNIKKQGITPKDDYDGILAKLEQRLIDAQKTPSNKAPKNVSQMMIGEPKPTGALEKSLVTKRSFNGDLQKYRYGTEKSPLSLEEYNHLKNSEFIDKQNTRDILMGMRPDLTEYSIWYKDKSGKIQNIQTYGNEFKKK